MNKFFVTFSFAVSMFLFVMVLPVSAGTLDFNPDSVTTTESSTFSADVTIDAGTDQIAGTDVYVKYDPQYLEVQTVTAGSFFPSVDNTPSSGKLYISGIIQNQGDYKTGQGTVAAITFKALKSGTTTVQYDCDLSKAETSKVVKNDINATNLINCSGNGTLTITIDASASSPGSSSPGSSGGTLPKSGIYDNVLQYSMTGALLLFAGVALRMLAR